MASELTKPQIDDYKAAARDLDADDDPKRFRERVEKLVRQVYTGEGGTGG